MPALARLTPLLAGLALAGCVSTVPVDETTGRPLTLPPPAEGDAVAQADMMPICAGQVQVVTEAPLAAIQVLPVEEDRGALFVRARHTLDSGVIDLYECIFTPEGLYRGVRRTA